MNIRNGRPSDLEAFFEMWWQSSLEHVEYNKLDQIKTKEEVMDIVIEAQKKCMRKKGHVFLIVEMEHGEPVGMATGHIDEREDEPTLVINKEGFIDEIYIVEKYRGLGFGKRLLDALMQRLYDQGAPFIGLAVSMQNPAVGFYERQGFYIKSLWMVKER